jgi:hypothetical protein
MFGSSSIAHANMMGIFFPDDMKNESKIVCEMNEDELENNQQESSEVCFQKCL